MRTRDLMTRKSCWKGRIDTVAGFGASVPPALDDFQESVSKHWRCFRLASHALSTRMMLPL